MGEDGICRIKGAEGLDFPIYSCEIMSSAMGRRNPCPAEHFFYLEETMTASTSETMPKLMAFKLSNDQIRFCGIIKPVGLRFDLVC
jgi:hypothetical protein